MNWLFDKNILIHFHGIQEKHPFLKYFFTVQIYRCPYTKNHVVLRVLSYAQF